MSAEVTGKIAQVAPIGGKRIGGGAALGRQHVEVEVDQARVVHANRIRRQFRRFARPLTRDASHRDLPRDREEVSGETVSSVW
jgi:hypothetical protein